MKAHPTYPQDAQALGQTPATEKVDLKLVVEDDDGVFLPVVGRGLWVGVDGALCAGPPLQKHHQLCNRPQGHTIHIYAAVIGKVIGL